MEQISNANHKHKSLKKRKGAPFKGIVSDNCKEKFKVER